MDDGPNYSSNRGSSLYTVENRNSTTSCFSSDDTEFLELPKSVAAHSKRYKTSVELRIMEDNHDEDDTKTHHKKKPSMTNDETKSSSSSSTNGAKNLKNPLSGGGKKRTFVKTGTKLAAARQQSPGAGSLGSESLSSRWSSSDEEASAYNDRSTYSKEQYNDDEEEEKESRDGLLDDVEDASICGDDDFRWVKTEPPSENRTASPGSSIYTKDSVSSYRSTKPPLGSLDRRRREPGKTRHERDSKSRSSHSLREKQRELNNSMDYLNRFVLHEHPSVPCLLNMNLWASRENLQKQADMFRSTQNLLHQQQCGASPAMYCHCNAAAAYNAFNSSSTLTMPHMICPTANMQRPDADERLRRLQSDKDALALQVQVLSEQVQLQNEKIVEMERLINEKNRLISNAEDLLQREMLSRSSLETHKLELMTALSELKLQNVAMDHENRELRTKCFGAAIAAQSKMRTMMENTSLDNTPNSLHRSHGSLSQGANLSVLSTPKTPPASYRQRVQLNYNSLPRHIITESLEGGSGEKERKNVAFAENDKVIDTSHERRSCTPQPSPSSNPKTKGLKGIFGKIKRSGSGNLEDLPIDDFKRGGVRATAGARLGYSYQPKKVDKPFEEYNIEDICGWLDELGLEVYIEEAKRWLKDGTKELITASADKVEKELSLKTPLHRKKIMLALADVTGQEKCELFKAAGKLDTVWVLRWLEDIGLPQYKDAFTAAKMDGRMLHRLSMDDLTQLHISSCLHIASLRRGIQLMRQNSWSDDVLIRRSSAESQDRDKVQCWTAHRVWDWLRVVDLAEYAPNLRGAGVHGALMMFEPRFTSELLADLLSIPPSKTLLRRHLSTHFKELLGRETIQAKRDAENTLGFQPLTLYAKIKKKPQFSLIRKKSFKGAVNGIDTSDLVCPLTDSSDETITDEREVKENHKSTRTKSIGCLSPQ